MSKVPASILALALLAGCQSATAIPKATITLEHVTPASTARPTVPVEIRQVPAEQLAAVCNLDPDRLVGCSYLFPTSCVIFLPDNLSFSNRRVILEHEKWHCAGGRHD